MGALLLAQTLGTGRAAAAELLYVFDPDCPACRKFDREAGRIYPKTREAQALPMRRVLLSDWQAGQVPESACVQAPVVGTPTFILLGNCSELDRITGYTSDEGFWMGLARMMGIFRGWQASEGETTRKVPKQK